MFDNLPPPAMMSVNWVTVLSEQQYLQSERTDPAGSKYGERPYSTNIIGIRLTQPFDRATRYTGMPATAGSPSATRCNPAARPICPAGEFRMAGLSWSRVRLPARPINLADARRNPQKQIQSCDSILHYNFVCNMVLR